MGKKRGTDSARDEALPTSVRLKTVRIGHFKVRINPKAGLMTEERGELVRRFKRHQTQLGSLSLPLPSLDEEVRSSRSQTLPTRERFNRSFESRMGLERGSVSSSHSPLPRSRFQPTSDFSTCSHDPDDDDDDDESDE